jgi:type IV pilus modification protein PilV
LAAGIYFIADIKLILLIVQGEEWQMTQAKKDTQEPNMKNNSGFTLIETMIAILVFTIGILAMVSLQTHSIRTNASAKQTTEAASATASVIEDLRPLNYIRDAELADGSHTRPDQDQYSISYTIQRDALLENTMLIQTTVTWTEGTKSRSMNLVYIKADII